MKKLIGIVLCITAAMNTNAQQNSNERSKSMIEKFTKVYAPSENCAKASPELLEAYKGRVPEALLNLWKTHGFGKYGNGLLEIVNPKDFEPTLWTWLGREVDTYVPIAISAFGELFYYRKLTDTDEDVCIVDIQYRKIETLAWGLDLFFEDFLLDKEMREEWLREKLFNEAMLKEKQLAPNEVFTFAPVFAMGGKAELKYLKRGNAQVYQDIVFQMTM